MKYAGHSVFIRSQMYGRNKCDVLSLIKVKLYPQFWAGISINGTGYNPPHHYVTYDRDWPFHKYIYDGYENISAEFYVFLSNMRTLN